MKKNFKKILSIMLVSTMVLTSVPTGTCAEDDISVADTEETETTVLPESDETTVLAENKNSKETENEKIMEDDGDAGNNTVVEQETNQENEPVITNKTIKKKDNKVKTSQVKKVAAMATAGTPDSKETLTVVWDKQEKYEWSGKEQENIPTASVKNSEGETITLIANLTGPTTDGKAMEPGNYTVTVSLSAEDEEKYLLANPTETFEIVKKDVTVIWNADETSGEYTGGIRELPKAYYKNINGVEVECAVREKDGKIFQDADVYKFIASTSDGNYNLKNSEYDFEITRKEIDIKWENVKEEYVYDGIVLQDGPTASFKDLVDGSEIIEVICDRGEIKNAGEYVLTAKLIAGKEKNYKIRGNAEQKIKIKSKQLNVTWLDENGKIVAGDEVIYEYDGEPHKITASEVKLREDADPVEVSVKFLDKDGNETEPKDVGTYEIQVNIGDNNCVLVEESVLPKITIEKMPVEIKWYKDEDCVEGWNGEEDSYTYDGTEQLPVAAYIGAKDTRIIVPRNDISVKSEENNDTEAVNADTYTVTASITDANYELQEDNEVSTKVTIVPCPVKVEWYENSIPKKYDGEVHSPTAYYTNLKGEPVGCDVTEKDAREIKNVGVYAVTASLKQDDTDSKNYELTDEIGRTFEIEKLNITVTPAPGQGKVYGESDQVPYEYDVSYIEDDLMEKEQVIEELENEMGGNILQRERGNGIGDYKYSLTEDSANYAVTVEEEYFEIKEILIEVEENKITSRKGSFSLTATNLDEDLLDNKTKRKIVITAEFPEDNQGIVFSEDIDDYISDAEKGIDFTGKVEKTIHIEDFEYKTTKEKHELKWQGKLPAGTVLKLSICDENGTRVSNIRTITVVKEPVTLAWSSTANENPATTYLGKNDKLKLTGSKEEYVEVAYNGTSYYETLDRTINPVINNAGFKHLPQTAAASFVDVLNLEFDKATYTFIYDNEAFQIPASSIRFENRGETISITLPERGILQTVTIPGGTVTVSGEIGEKFELPVKWSGKSLILSGSTISVTYADQRGNSGNGSSTVSRSTVTTPITLKIRPELNANGYLNGGSNTLIVSGSACSCEPIRVTVADMSQSTYASQKEVWSDSNGTWETMFDISRLPEGKDFQITAEYMDVNGPGAAMTAKFNAYVASPVALSPVYEAMTHISGMVEAGTTALLIIGDKYYEMEVDRFGHFRMNDVPMMFGGEDSFDIFVTDIAGNTSIRHYDIPEPEDPFVTGGTVNPLGKIFYSGDSENSYCYVATPVKADDFEEKTIELPLLLGMSYEVGTFTLTKTENGFVVASQIKMDDAMKEDYEIKNENLYVYTSRPTIEEMRKHTGKEYRYGEEILLQEDETVWVVDEKEMTILVENMEELELFDYEHSEEYVKYQEQ